ncbi:SUZ RNA-binding domain-containing isoform 7-T7 [Spheniscus humboldti]
MRGARAGGGGGGGGELKWKMRRSPRAGRRRPTAGFCVIRITQCLPEKGAAPWEIDRRLEKKLKITQKERAGSSRLDVATAMGKPFKKKTLKGRNGRPLKESWYYFSGTSAQRRDHKKNSDGETGAKAGSEKGNGRFEAEGWVSWREEP